MTGIELVRIKGGVETVLEICEMPDGMVPDMAFYPKDYIEGLEENYRKTGRPRRKGIDVLYLTRPQTGRWPEEVKNG